ncbi:MAG: two-component system response regulator, partial [Clostridiaceae bacterium]|nr:two-component system response regulator [Clostridiaceae bacterium]
MLKIMIVDDEFYFREAIKISLPWAELGFEICGEAKNGRDALKKVEVLKPEI